MADAKRKGGRGAKLAWAVVSPTGKIDVDSIRSLKRDCDADTEFAGEKIKRVEVRVIK